MSELHGADAVETIAADIDAWLADFAVDNPILEAAHRDLEDDRRWYVRLAGEHKEHITIWLHLGERTLRYEAYVMPAAEEQHEVLYEMLLRYNERLVGVHFAIGVEDAVFARGDLPLRALDHGELDRVVGSLYAAVDGHFDALMRVGYATRYRGAG